MNTTKIKVNKTLSEIMQDVKDQANSGRIKILYSSQTTESSKSNNRLNSAKLIIQDRHHDDNTVASYVAITKDGYLLTTELITHYMTRPLDHDVFGVQSSTYKLHKLFCGLDSTDQDEIRVLNYLANNPDKAIDLVSRILNTQSRIIKEQSKIIREADWAFSNVYSHISKKWREMYSKVFSSLSRNGFNNLKQSLVEDNQYKEEEKDIY